jgi:hypothetical protein
MAGESPDTQKAKAMLLAELESAAPAAATVDIAADSSIAELKELAQKCIDRSLALHDVEVESVAAQPIAVGSAVYSKSSKTSKMLVLLAVAARGLP